MCDLESVLHAIVHHAFLHAIVRHAFLRAFSRGFHAFRRVFEHDWLDRAGRDVANQRFEAAPTPRRSAEFALLSLILLVL